MLLLLTFLVTFAQNNDCSEAVVLCNSQPIAFNPSGPGANDFAGGGSNPGCLSSLEHQSAWYYIEIAPNSPPNALLAFDLIPNAGAGQDYDFAMFGPNVPCGGLGSPIRCSYAAGSCTYCPNTGMSDGTPPAGDASEGAIGDGYVAGLTVQPGQSFYLLIDNFSNNSTGFSLNWTGNAVLDCTGVPPCNFNLTASADVIRCQGQGPFGISASVTGATGPITYMWSPGTFLSNSSVANPTVTIPGNVTGTFTYVISATNNGCTDSDTLVITVNPSPVVTITPAGPFCTNSGPQQLTATPSGGVWSGPGINPSTGIFNPVSVGTFNITYSVTQSGCSGSQTIQIQVYAPPVPNIVPPPPICESAASIQLSATPSGGTWGGAGVSSTGLFDPSIGAGVHAVTYTVTANGCTSTATAFLNVIMSNVNINDPGPLCVNGAPIVLTATPSGGFWTGTTGTGGAVNPATLGSGIHTITYTVNGGSCPGSDQINLVINAAPTPSIVPVGPFCSDDSPVFLSASPSGGVWSGDVTFAGQFNPMQGPGIYDITYTSTNAFGCVGVTTLQIEVLDGSTATISGPTQWCQNEGTVTYTGTPAGGTWSGVIGSNGVLDPTTVTPGTYQITYNYTNAAGCSSSDVHSVQIFAPPVVNINNPGTYCVGQGTQTLTATPVGGTWSGNVSAGGQFNPTTLGAGTYSATYTYTNFNGCTENDMVTFTVGPQITVVINPAGPFCVSDPAVQLTATPSGGTWSGPGTTAAGSFNPATAGAGTHTITYNYTSPQGCSGSNTIQITVQTAPVVTITGPITWCQNESSLTFTATPAGGTWGGIASATGTVDPAAHAAGTYQITYNYTSPSGCSGSDTHSLQILAPPTVTINAAGPFCAGQGVQQLTGTPVGGTWSGAAGASGQFTPTTAGTYVVTYTYTNLSGCQNAATASITVNALPTPSITPAGPFCTDDGIQTLAGSPAGGTWGGAANASGQFNPAISGAGTHLVTYTVTSSGCTSTATANMVVNAVPTATISGGGNICGGGDTETLTITTTGTGNLTVIYAIDNIAQSPVNVTGGSSTTISASTPGNYTIISVTSANGCNNTGSGLAVVTLVSAPVVSNIVTTCNPTNTNFVVTFQISGGNPATYTVTGGAGTLTGNTFTSAPIPSGAGYNFTVNDVNNCNPAIVSDPIVECNCATMVGTMSSVLITICGNNCATATYNSGGGFLDGDDVLEFILHTNSGSSLGTIIARNDSAVFCFNSAIMTAGTTYYISAVVGNNAGNGMVNINDNCLAVSQGTPVVYQNIPTAVLGVSGEICNGSSYTLTVNFTGTAPFGFVWSDGTTNTPVNNISSNPYTFNVSPANTTNYSLISLTDANCTGTVSGTATVTVNGAPLVNNIQTICNPTGTAYVVTFEITGGEASTYTVTGGAGIITPGNPAIFTSTSIIAGNGYAFTFNDGNNCNPVAVTAAEVVCNCLSDVGTMSSVLLEACGIDCISAVYDATGQNLDGDDALMFVLHTGTGTSIGTVIASSATPDFCYIAPMSYNTTFYVSAVVGNNDGTGGVDLNDNCLAVSAGTPVVFHPLPTATMSGSGNICLGDNYDISISLTGTSPWTVIYNDGVNDITESNITSNPYNFQVSPASTSTYSLVSVTDQFCNNTAAGSISVEVNTAPTVSNIQVICNPTNTAYTVSFEISGGNPSVYPYTVAGLPGSISPSAPYIFTSAPIANFTGYSFSVTDANDCNPVVIADPLVSCDCETASGTMDLTPLTLCFGEIAVASHFGDEVLDSDDLLLFALHDGNSAALGNVIAYNTVPEFSFDASTMEYFTTYYISAVAGNNNGSGGIDTADPCLSVAQGTPVLFIPSPYATMSGDTTICIGNSAFLYFNFPDDYAYDIVYTDGTNNFPLNNIMDGFSTIVNPTGNTTYSIIEISYSNYPGCVTTLPAGTPGSKASVNVILSPPTAINVQEICNATNTAYTVSFELINGDVSTYTVTGGAGTLNGNIFTSAEIANGGSYNFILDDSNGCNPYIVSGSHACNCATAVGLMDANTLNLCENDQATGLYDDLSEVLDGDDIVEFILHDGTGFPLGNIIDISSTPNFAFDPATMFFETTYYISAAAGSIGANGNINLTDPCAQVSFGTPVVFHDESNVTISGNATICTGGSANISISFTGIGPFEISYTVNGTGVSQTISSNTLTLPVSPLTTTTYALTGFNDLGNAGGCTGFNPSSVTVNVNETFFAGLAGVPTALCQGEANSLVLNDQLAGEDAGGTWTVLQGTPGSAFNAAAGSLQTAGLPVGQYQFLYTLTAAPPCPADTTAISVFVNEIPLADAGLDETITCLDTLASVGGVNSTSGTNIAYEWIAENGLAVPGNTLPVTTVQQPGTYTLTVLNTVTGCQNSDEVECFAANIPPLLNITALPISCHGDEDAFIWVESVSGGYAPFTYSMNGAPFSDIDYFPNLAAGNYIIDVVDANGCSNQASISILDPEELSLDLGPDTLIYFGDTIQLNAMLNIGLNGISSFEWETSGDSLYGNDLLSPWMVPSYTTHLSAIVVDTSGCSDADNMTIFVEFPRNVFIPNLFDPSNTNAANNTFTIWGDEDVVKVNYLRIYDRWGNMVFGNEDFLPNDPAEGWDGGFRNQDMNNAVFVYYAEILFKDGLTLMYVGDVTLKR